VKIRRSRLPIGSSCCVQRYQKVPPFFPGKSKPALIFDDQLRIEGAGAFARHRQRASILAARANLPRDAPHRSQTHTRETSLVSRCWQSHPASRGRQPSAKSR
jgi:hypothetical protein